MKLTAAMADRQWTGPQLARALGVHPNTVGKWLRGQREPLATAALWICQILDIDPAELAPLPQGTPMARIAGQEAGTSPTVRHSLARLPPEGTISVLETIARLERRVAALEASSGEGPEPPGQSGHGGQVAT